MNSSRYIRLTMLLLLAACTAEAPPPADVAQEAEDSPAPAAADADRIERGPHAGRVLRAGEFAVELTIFEAGIPPEFHVYGYVGGQPLAPEQFDVDVALARLGGAVDRFEFEPAGEFLRGQGVVEEPHSFDVTVRARYGEEPQHEWQFASYEGRMRIPPETAKKIGLATAKAGPAQIREQIAVGGVVRNAGSGVHAQIDAYGPEGTRLRVGQPVELEAVVGDLRGAGTIRALEPRTIAGKRVVRAHVELNELASKWPLERFVRAHVTTAVHPVPLAVRTDALQRFRDSDVVFARVGDEYEVRLLDLGWGDREWTEVRAGLAREDTYVTENSFLLRAEIQKVDGGHTH